MNLPHFGIKQRGIFFLNRRIGKTMMTSICNSIFNYVIIPFMVVCLLYTLSLICTLLMYITDLQIVTQLQKYRIIENKRIKNDSNQNNMDRNITILIQ